MGVLTSELAKKAADGVAEGGLGKRLGPNWSGFTMLSGGSRVEYELETAGGPLTRAVLGAVGDSSLITAVSNLGMHQALIGHESIRGPMNEMFVGRAAGRGGRDG